MPGGRRMQLVGERFVSEVKRAGDIAGEAREGNGKKLVACE